MVGEGPGREEADAGRPFVGATGRVLGEEMLKAGLVREQLYITNATCCKPTLPKKEVDMRLAVECCRPALMAQLRALNPAAHIMTLGKWGYFALTGREKGVINARGFIRPIQIKHILKFWEGT
jgi:DNA polymerase